MVAVALFGVAGTIAATILIDVVQLERRSEIHNAVYRDASVLMQQIVNEVRNGTIDYEEYYSINVVQADDVDVYHGVNHGVYASRFYDPGDSLSPGDPINPNHLGVECALWDGATGGDCEIIYTLSFDLNTGQNPYIGNPQNMTAGDANAFCDGRLGGVNCDEPENGEVEELYLIDKSGTRKTIIAVQDYPADGWGVQRRLGIVRMTGVDFDQNGVVDIFSCDEGFSCESGIANKIPYPDSSGFVDTNNVTLPKKDSPAAFVPLSPGRAEVENITFIIRPLEDPYRAYAERNMQQHPSVTIILTLGLSESAKKDYPGDFTPITVQTTVSAGSRERIESYPPVTEFRENLGDVSWIEKVFSP